MGDVSVAKEWTYAGDVANGILTLVEQDNIFETVIGSGKTYTIQDWIEVCFSQLGLDWRVHLEKTGNFKAEYKRLISNPKLIQSLGWEAKVSFSELANMMIGK